MAAKRGRKNAVMSRYLVYLRTEAGTERRIAEIRARNDGHASELARKAGYGRAVRVAPFTPTPRDGGDRSGPEGP